MTAYSKIAANIKVPNGIYIDGAFGQAQSGATFETSNPFDGVVIGKVPACNSSDVDRAAFESGVWSDLHPSERKKVLCRFVDLIAEDAELAVMEAMDAGKPITDCVEIDVPETADCIRWHGEAQDKLYDQIAPSSPDGLGLIVR